MRVNGMLLIANNKKEAAAVCFSLVEDLKYWSYDGLKKLYVGALRMLADYQGDDNLKGQKKAADTRFKTYCADRIRYTPRDHLRLLTTIYDLILGCEKMSRLNGFKISDNSFINAEVVRITRKRE